MRGFILAQHKDQLSPRLFHRHCDRTIGESLAQLTDPIEADVAGAQAARLKGALVRTGKFGSTDLDSAVRPDVVFDSIADLPRWWRGQSG
jgi:ribonucleotide monophosphatase NagD (HAD superfamily)